MRHPYREQRKPRLLDHRDKQEALPGIRSMLADPSLCYQTIGKHFGVTRQRIAQIAAEMGVDGRRRQRERQLRMAAAGLQREADYPANVRVVIQKLKRAGLKISPYRAPRSHRPDFAPAAKRRVLVNGVLCRIYCRRAAIITGRTGHEYVQFFIGKRTRAVKVALFAFWKDRSLKLYVVPVRDLNKLSAIWIPYSGREVRAENLPCSRSNP
jgi:hypothetical protein